MIIAKAIQDSFFFADVSKKFSVESANFFLIINYQKPPPECSYDNSVHVLFPQKTQVINTQT